jgi:hypothetical protein
MSWLGSSTHYYVDASVRGELHWKRAQSDSSRSGWRTFYSRGDLTIRVFRRRACRQTGIAHRSGAGLRNVQLNDLGQQDCAKIVTRKSTSNTPRARCRTGVLAALELERKGRLIVMMEPLQVSRHLRQWYR